MENILSHQISPNDIVETNKGLVARVIYVIGDSASCRWIGNPIQFTCPLPSLRYLGDEKGPLQDSPPDLDKLIQSRNEEAIQWFIQKTLSVRGRGRAKKEKTLVEKLEAAQDNPQEFQRLLREGGLI